MATPTDLPDSGASMRWTKRRGLITGAVLLGVMTIVSGIFFTLGARSSAGGSTPIPLGDTRTPISGLLKGAGAGAPIAAVPGADYASPTDVDVADVGPLGAGDDSNVFATAAARALAKGRALYVPCGTYVFATTVEVAGVPLRTGGQGCTLFRSSRNLPIFRMIVTGRTVQNQDFGGYICRYEMAAGAAYSDTACLDIEGDSTARYQYNNIHDIGSLGAYATFVVGKGNTKTPFGYESLVSVNTFARITGNGYTTPGRYIFWFKTGSGTANVYSQIDGGGVGIDYDGHGHTDPEAAIWRFEGTDASGHALVVGDVSIDASQFQAPTKIASIGAGVVYAQNINYGSSQLDGNGTPFSFDASPGVVPQSLRVVGDNIGGGVDIYAGLGLPIQRSIIQDQYVSSWTAGVEKDPKASATGTFFKFEIGSTPGNSGYLATVCHITANGLIGGAGSAMSQASLVMKRNGTRSAAQTYFVDRHFVNHDGGEAPVDGGTATMPDIRFVGTGAAPVAPAMSSIVSLAVELPASAPASGNDIELQIACTGGQFRLQRITN